MRTPTKREQKLRRAAAENSRKTTESQCKEEEARERILQSKEKQQAIRHRTKLAEREARTTEREKRASDAARLRRVKESERAERDEARASRAAYRKTHPGFYNPDLRLHTVLRFLLGLIGLFVFISLILRDGAGQAGAAISDALFGCFSFTAFLVPVFMLLHSLLWIGDVRTRLLLPKAVCFPIFLVLSAAMCAVYSPAGADAFSAGAAWTEGLALRGGGAVGGAVGYALSHVIGTAGMWLLYVLVTVFLLFLYLRESLRRLYYRISGRAEEDGVADLMPAPAPRAPARPKEDAPVVAAPEPAPAAKETPTLREMPVTEEPETPAPAAKAPAAPTPAAKEDAAPKEKKGRQRRAAFNAEEDGSFTVERRRTKPATAGRGLFDFETAETEPLSAMSPEERVFAPRAAVEAEKGARKKDFALMGWDEDEDFSDDALSMVTERIRPIRADEPSPDVRPAQPAKKAPAAPAKEATDGMDYFRSIAVAAETPEESEKEERRADFVPPVAPVREPVQEPVRESVRPAPAPAEREAPRAVFDFDTAEEEPEDAPESTPEEETPFTPQSDLRTDLRAADALVSREPVRESPRPASGVGIGSMQSAPDAGFGRACTPAPQPAAAKSPAARPAAPAKRPYRYPPASLLTLPEVQDNESIRSEIQENAEKLVQTMADFGINIRVTGYTHGPRITRYEVLPEAGVRVRKITGLVDEISMSLATSGIRIEAPIPGKSAVGIEVPNAQSTVVRLREMLDTAKFRDDPNKTLVCVGSDVTGQPVYCKLSKMPHMLIAGATGMGKSVCINSIILSLLYKASPDEVRLIMIDPKKVEFGMYSGIPHLLVPVVTDPQKAAGALSWAVGEMEHRFELIERAGVRNLDDYNRNLREAGEGGTLPYIIIIIDELHDLMMSAAESVETSIARITAKARAAGIHLLIGTQRPSVDVITGTIKSNIPSRIAFHVSSQVDSRTILDFAGAEKLLPHGDMLYAPVGIPKPQRVQGAYVDEKEVDRVVEFLKENNDADDETGEQIMADIEREAEKCCKQKRDRDEDEPGAGANIPADSDDNHLQWAALEVGLEFGRLSTSLLQRKLKVGYGKAAMILDALCENGYISEPNGSKPREILITREEFKEMMARGVKEVCGDDL